MMRILILVLMVTVACGFFVGTTFSEEPGFRPENETLTLGDRTRAEGEMPAASTVSGAGVTIETQSAPRGSATDQVQRTLLEIKRVLDQKELTLPKRNQRMKEIVNKRFLDSMGLLRDSMGPHWKSVKDMKKRERLHGAFLGIITHNYIRKAEEYSQGRYRLVVNEERPAGSKRVDVVTMIHRSSDELEAIFRMEKQTDGEWRCVDVQLDETSLAGSYRSAFGPFMAKPEGGGVDALIQKLEARLEQLQKSSAG